MLIKICGITTPKDAIACFNAGADIIGLVHYPPSPRHVDVEKIREILRAVEPWRTSRYVVLVVVDQVPDEEIVSQFDFIQLYGDIQHGCSFRQIHVVKDYETFTRLLQSPPERDLERDFLYYCLEMSEGRLPGGNGAAWDWSMARPFCERYPTFIAGGITPENVADVIRLAQPCGIDVSSGVESSPGVKDMDKVRRLIENTQ